MRLAILTNILTPYRKFFFDTLNEELERRGSSMRVFVMSESEPNRSWSYSDFQTSYTVLLKSRAFDLKGIYLHINPDLICRIEEYNPTVIVCAGSYLEPSVLKVLASKRRLGIPIVFWSESHLQENKEASELRIRIREAVRRFVYPRFDAFWIAGKMSLQLIEKYVDQPDSLFVPNLVDPDLYRGQLYVCTSDIRAQLHISSDSLVLFTPARLSSVKGLIEFINLLSEVRCSKNIDYIIAGEGELREEIERLSKELPINVHLVGQRSENEIAELYAVADYFVMPSLSDPNPLSCVEACWSELPLLVSDHVGNYPELIQQGVNGWVFSYAVREKSVGILQDAFSQSVSWRKVAGSVSRKIAMDKYSPVSSCERIVDWLEGLSG